MVNNIAHLSAIVLGVCLFGAFTAQSAWADTIDLVTTESQAEMNATGGNDGSTVAGKETGTRIDTQLTIALECSSILYQTTANTLIAKLIEKDSGNGVKEAAIAFYVNGSCIGFGKTDDTGMATLTYDPSNLKTGYHSITAVFQKTDRFESSSDSTTQCVTYHMEKPIPFHLDMNMRFLRF